ncbi:beta-N-acetylhexosaminidase [Cohnella abietis]|uniref:N-acetyl-beta-D-glucosaminidase n=1 Tax=Cohnella abietis TaxID=2507935 RepID=A0A3T1D7P7_9BACL|nr:beta-N-acetylhexosaminidase [Cohnella abietis]BBI34093.1 N-acetyl-beta-D-glucosaminidase [Cohnella abietis]
MAQLELFISGKLPNGFTGLEMICESLSVRLLDSGVPVTLEQVNQAELTVIFDGACATIRYAQENHLYRAIGLLVEGMISDKPFEIREEPQFDTVGFMLDCSRNAVPKIERVKELLLKMALMGMNALMLYTEDTYALEDEPYFGYMRGRYTSEELKECDAYASSLGIEMIPCIQTLAHLDTFLKWEAASKLRDSQDVLLVGDDHTYEFIDRMVGNVSRTYQSRRIHIGMDEAHNLGRGRSLDMHGYRDPSELMNEHLIKVTGITQSYGLQPMLWSDMSFRTASATHDYYDPDVSFTEADANRVPSGAQLVYWDYYHYDQPFYETMIRKHKQLGSMPVFAGGIWTWLGMCTHYDRTFKSTNAALQACKQEGVREVFATAWGDNGAENNVWTVLPGLQLFAEHAYARVLDEQKLRRRTTFCTGIPYEYYISIDMLDDIPGLIVEHGDTSNPSKYLLWQDVLLGLFDKHIEGLEVSQHYQLMTDTFSELAQHSAQALRIFEIPARLSEVLKLKADMGVRLKRAYDSEDRTLLEHFVGIELPDLLQKVEALRISHRRLWMNTNKPFGWEVLDIRYGGLTARLQSTKDRIQEYLEGVTSKIEELEETRLFFDNRDKQGGAGTDYFCTYHLIASPNKMT